MPTKKYLGQHFLHNKKKLERLVTAIRGSRSVIEIGPGRGDLTRVLLDAGMVVWAIEKDGDLVPFLQKKFSRELKEKQLHIIVGDALVEIHRIKLDTLGTTDYVIMGNIPYYITGQLFRLLGELPHKPIQAVLMVQKEVADRVCAQVGSMNILAASIGWWATARIITRIPRRMFNPPPRVDSAVILLERNIPDEMPSVDRVMYFNCVRAIYKQPRKTALRNLLDAGYERRYIEKIFFVIGMSLRARPKDFSVSDIARISKVITMHF